MVFVSIALLLAIGWIALRSGDEYAIARQKQLLGNAFEAADQVAGEVTPQVFWQDAYEHVRNRDIPWIDANLGKYMTGLFGYDHLFVVDSADRPIYSLQHGKEDIGLAHYRAMQPAIAQSLADVRNALTAPAGGQGSDNATSLSMKMLSDGTRLPLVIVGNLESIMGRPSAIVAATIVPDLDSRSFSGKPDVLVATRELNGAFLKSVASRFGFQDLRWGADNGGGSSAMTSRPRRVTSSARSPGSPFGRRRPSCARSRRRSPWLFGPFPRSRGGRVLYAPLHGGRVARPRQAHVPRDHES